jgi:uncharacterized integral membrane protein
MGLWRYSLGLISFVFFIGFAVANDNMVKVNIYINLIKEDGLEFVYLPLYIVVFISLLLGMLIGIILENVKCAKLRNLIRSKEVEIRKIEFELNKNKEKFFSEEEKIMDMLN